MSIVITGGAGFLGSLVTERLLAADPAAEVVSVDLAPSRVADERVRSVVGDLTDPAVLADAVGPGTEGSSIWRRCSPAAPRRTSTWPCG